MFSSLLGFSYICYNEARCHIQIIHPLVLSLDATYPAVDNNGNEGSYPTSSVELGKYLYSSTII